MDGYKRGAINTMEEDEEELQELLELPIVQETLFGSNWTTPVETRNPKLRYDRRDWEAHVRLTVANGTFQQRYHMSHETFKKLVDLLDIQVDARQSMRSTSGNSPITPTLIVAGVLRYLGGSKSIDMADFLGCSIPSFHRVVDLFLAAVIGCEPTFKSRKLLTTIGGVVDAFFFDNGAASTK